MHGAWKAIEINGGGWERRDRMDIEEDTLRASTNMGRQDVHEVPHLFILRRCILGLFGLGVEDHSKEPVVRDKSIWKPPFPRETQLPWKPGFPTFWLPEAWPE